MYLCGLLLYGNLYSQTVPRYHGNLSLRSGASNSFQLETQDLRKTKKEHKCNVSKTQNTKVMSL